MGTPLRRLEGISYWVIEDPDGIHDFINTEVRKEWEEDVRSLPDDPASGVWLATLPRRRWRLDVVRTTELRLDESVMNYVDSKSGYDFAQRLAKRREELRRGIELWKRVIWPVIVREEDMEVLDGYCRLTTLKEMGISRIYTYIGKLP